MTLAVVETRFCNLVLIYVIGRASLFYIWSSEECIRLKIIPLYLSFKLHCASQVYSFRS